MNAIRIRRRRRGRGPLSIFCVAMVLLLLMQGVSAEALFKCRNADGVSSYQSVPCAQSAQQIWQREVTPEPEPRVAPHRPPTRQPVRLRASTVRVRSARAAAPRVNACASARAAADDERDRRWYTITFDRLRQLDAMVARACK